MKIRVLTSKTSWYYPKTAVLKTMLEELGHEVYVFGNHNNTDDTSYDVTFLLSYFSILKDEELSKSRNNIVIHESDLPSGKGWSPLTWQILEGKNSIIVSMIEASANVDSGDIYIQKLMSFEGHELIDEMRSQLADVMKDMVIEFCRNFPNNKGVVQEGVESFYKRRRPRDSQLDINQSIEEQINLLRVVDNDDYPAFFIYKGKKYIIKVTKENVDE